MRRLRSWLLSRGRRRHRLLAALALLGSGLGHAQGLQGVPVGLGPVRPAQPLFAPACAAPRSPLQRVVWDVTTAGGTRTDLSCHNAFVGLPRTPRSPALLHDAFDDLAAQIRAARSEVLVANMQWDFGLGLPGSTVAGAVADLYAQVRARPADYPQGMAVRFSLGGYPDLVRTVDGGTQALSLARDLRLRGVPLSDPALGWRVSILNYPYFPHSHVKLHVIDGQDLTVAGYNFSWTQLPRSEGGNSQHDVGLRMRGPVAQAGVAAFDDLWRHSQQLHCPPDVLPVDVFTRCALGRAEAPSHPLAAQFALPAGQARGYLLYRRPGDDQADRGHLALIAAARRSIDLMQVDFSPEPVCWGAHLGPDGCGADAPGFPVYLRALLGALERGVRVRVLLMPNSSGLERPGNRAGVALMRAEARRRGLEHLFEARFVTFTMHDKTVTFDRELVLVGSMNFHFSAWGPLGLNEAALVTDDLQAVSQQEATFERVWQSDTLSRPAPPEWWLPYVRPFPAASSAGAGASLH